jgi:multidrug efflux system outer membrane protein
MPPAFALPDKEEAPAGLPVAMLGWQQFFGDPQLKAYVAAALANNKDLVAATARIEQARAQFRTQQAQRLPQPVAQAGATRSHVPLSSLGLGSEAGSGAITYDQFTGQVAVSQFEIDFWGRVRNLAEAARRQYLATVEARRAFRLSLIGDVAATYYAIRSGEEGVALAERAVASREQGLEIARLRMEAGVTSSVDYDQAFALFTQARTQLADLQRTTEQQRNRLRALIGGPVPEPVPAGKLFGEADQFAKLDPGLPSALLEDRPDIRQAEQRLRAADANIGAARAAFFPTVSLTGAFGFASPQLSALFDSGNRSWSFGGNAGLPLFDWGQRKAQLRLSEAQRDELVASYQKTVQNAFREVADGLVGRRRLREQIAAQVEAVSAQRRLTETAAARYQNGISIYLEVLDAERNLFSAEQQLITLRASELQNEVSLYVALGGGELAYEDDAGTP